MSGPQQVVTPTLRSGLPAKAIELIEQVKEAEKRFKVSGHSKWSQIKRQKGAADAKRGQLFTKLAKIIAVAAKQGGGDPAMNASLRVAVEQARSENMPKDSIERAIKRGTGELGGAAIEQLRFEAYGPGGVGILIDAATDNHLRTTAEVKAILNKFGGKLATTGAVAFQFSQQGIVTVPITADGDAEVLELAFIEAGADSYAQEGDVFVVTTDPKTLSQVKSQLERQGGMTITEAKLSWEPAQTLTITDAGIASQIIRLLTALEDLDDVTAVTSNFDAADEILAQVG